MDPGSRAGSSGHPPDPRREPGPAAVPPRWGIGDFVWIYLAGVVGSILAAAVGLAVTGDQSGHVGAVTTAFSLAGQFGTWLACLAYVARAKGRNLRDDFGAAISARDAWVVAVGVGVAVVANLVVAPLQRLADEHQQVVDDLRHAGAGKYAVLVVAAVLVAPVCEELLFRGLLLRALRRRMSPEWAVVVQALAFACAHPLLSPTLGDLAAVPGLFLFGAASGWFAVRRDDLSASFVLHIAFNAFAFVVP